MRRVRLEGFDYGAGIDPAPPLAGGPDIPLEQPQTDRFRKVVRRDRFSDALVADAKAMFERRLGRPVSANEARNLLGNLTDLMWLMIRWEVKAGAKGRSAPASAAEPVEPAD